MVTDTQSAINQASTSLRNFAKKTQGEKGEMNKNDFLNLFMTQVSNQDPLNPMDSAGMMTQIAQMGSMEQLQNLNGKVEKMITQNQHLLKMNSQTLLGTEISYKDNMIRVEDGKTGPISYRLPDDANTTVASIIGKDGETVKQIQIGQQKKGLHQFEWNGKNEKNEQLSDGNYHVNFLAVNENGKEVTVDMNRTKRIDKIVYQQDAPVFYMGDKRMTLDEINMFDKKSAEQFSKAVPFDIKKHDNPKP